MKKRNQNRLSATVILCLAPVFFCSCVVGMPSYLSAAPECLEYAIASCRAAIVEDGLEAGLIHYIPAWGDGSAHCVVWVKEKNGVERVYDPAYGMYRTITEKDVILHKGEGLDLGIFAMLLTARKTEVAQTGPQQ